MYVRIFYKSQKSLVIFLFEYNWNKRGFGKMFFFSLFCGTFLIVVVLQNLQVLACNTIVRCRACRSYINPFVTFIDQSRWKCNLCDRTNDRKMSTENRMSNIINQSSSCIVVPQEFYHDPVTHTVGDPQRRPEVRTATIEYIAPQEYSVRNWVLKQSLKRIFCLIIKVIGAFWDLIVLIGSPRLGRFRDLSVLFSFIKIFSDVFCFDQFRAIVLIFFDNC